ncbi:hypothetical protein C7M84_003342 [Penaeus vannamei]|uniref:Uncharacterized protein n=1 Tax=Penaeus vannamei TaxID=6689 RepID=A0A423TNF5_PENVA|nr:hypothetical protein C7M84_003342 [Penaeus vannamei]
MIILLFFLSPSRSSSFPSISLLNIFFSLFSTSPPPPPLSLLLLSFLSSSSSFFSIPRLSLLFSPFPLDPLLVILFHFLSLSPPSLPLYHIFPLHPLLSLTLSSSPCFSSPFPSSIFYSSPFPFPLLSSPLSSLAFSLPLSSYLPPSLLLLSPLPPFPLSPPSLLHPSSSPLFLFSPRTQSSCSPILYFISFCFSLSFSSSFPILPGFLFISLPSHPPPPSLPHPSSSPFSPQTQSCSPVTCFVSPFISLSFSFPFLPLLLLLTSTPHSLPIVTTNAIILQTCHLRCLLVFLPLPRNPGVLSSHSVSSRPLSPSHPAVLSSLSPPVPPLPRNPGVLSSHSVSSRPPLSLAFLHRRCSPGGRNHFARSVPPKSSLFFGLREKTLGF